MVAHPSVSSEKIVPHRSHIRTLDIEFSVRDC
jgi:hypothetical protein